MHCTSRPWETEADGPWKLTSLAKRQASSSTKQSQKNNESIEENIHCPPLASTCTSVYLSFMYMKYTRAPTTTTIHKGEAHISLWQQCEEPVKEKYMKSKDVF